MSPYEIKQQKFLLSMIQLSMNLWIWFHTKSYQITRRKFQIAPAAVDFDEFLGTMKMTAPKQIIWKIAPTYKPYRMTIANKLSCAMSNASMLLYAMNSKTFTISKKQEKSCKILKNPIFHDFFRRDLVFGAATTAVAAIVVVVAFEFSFAQFFSHTSIQNSIDSVSIYETEQYTDALSPFQLSIFFPLESRFLIC